MNEPESMRQRALHVLRNEMPSRLPFITRLQTWHRSCIRTDTLPEKFHGLTLDQVHASVGVGRLEFASPWALRLRGVEVRAAIDGEVLFHSSEPVITKFPGMWDLVPTDRAGETITELITPRGRLTLQHVLLAENVRTATKPYLKRHLLQAEEDFPILEYILDRAEVVRLHAKVKAEERMVGEHGLVVAQLSRIPFQQLLLEYLGEIPLVRLLHGNPSAVHRLLAMLDAQMMLLLKDLAALDVPYVEFPDNLHGPMTSPPLFREYCLPAYQKYSELLHGQGKKVGTHGDGNLRPLLSLLTESGLDVCESFSPYPLTPCTFEEAWRAWERGPRIWGAIPSTLLEERTAHADFRNYIANLLTVIDRPIILGIVDLFMHHNSIERVEELASWIEAGRVPTA